MLTFLQQRKRTAVRRMLQNRMNRNYFKQFRYGKRTDPRSNYCEVVWFIPYNESTGKPDFSRLTPLVTKDASSEGLSLLHTEPMTADTVLIGFPAEDGNLPTFVHCEHTHSSALGFGHFQVGLHPVRLTDLSLAEQTQLKLALAALDRT